MIKNLAQKPCLKITRGNGCRSADQYYFQKSVYFKFIQIKPCGLPRLGEMLEVYHGHRPKPKEMLQVTV